jgi:hypothetical protein
MGQVASSFSHRVSQGDEWGIEMPDDQPTNLAVRNFVFSQNIDFILKSLNAISKIFGGDSTTTVVFWTMARASVSHVNSRNKLSPEAVDGVFPDHLRRPVAVLSISNYLGLPYETTRRHVMKLVELGYVRRIGSREFLISRDILTRPEFEAIAGDTYNLAVQYYRNVAEHL